MKIFSIALTLGLLVVASDVRADRPPGNQVMIRPTHDRYAVTLMLSLSGSTACGPNYGAMALLGPGGGIIQDPAAAFDYVLDRSTFPDAMKVEHRFIEYWAAPTK